MHPALSAVASCSRIPNFVIHLLNELNMIWSVISLQLLGFVFLVLDYSFDVSAYDPSGLFPYSNMLEIAALSMLIGALACSVKLVLEASGNRAGARKRPEAGVGVFAGFLDEHFRHWSLTPSERDVALLTIKGLTILEIARLRRTSTGTVKAQCCSVYRKASVKGRIQLLSLLIEELAAREVS